MKRFSTLIFILLISNFAMATPSLFKKGIHYQVLAKTASKQPTVSEYFAFYNPGSYRFRSVVKEIQKALPEGTIFTKEHVPYSPVSIKTQNLLTIAVITAQRMGIEDKIIKAIFKRIYIDRKFFIDYSDLEKIYYEKLDIVIALKDNGEKHYFEQLYAKDAKDAVYAAAKAANAEIKELFAVNGADLDEFDKIRNSFYVVAKQKANNKLIQRRIIKTVPTLIVNNKYKVITSELRTLDDYISLVKFLLTL